MTQHVTHRVTPDLQPPRELVSPASWEPSQNSHEVHGILSAIASRSDTPLAAANEVIE
jgi:hypothetical protein